MKTHVNLYIDSNLVEHSKLKNLSLSNLLTQTLKNILEQDTDSIEDEANKTKETLEEDVLKLQGMIMQKKQVLKEMKKERDKKEREAVKHVFKNIIIK